MDFFHRLAPRELNEDILNFLVDDVKEHPLMEMCHECLVYFDARKLGQQPGSFSDFQTAYYDLGLTADVTLSIMDVLQSLTIPDHHLINDVTFPTTIKEGLEQELDCRAQGKNILTPRAKAKLKHQRAMARAMERAKEEKANQKLYDEFHAIALETLRKEVHLLNHDVLPVVYDDKGECME